jgi:hypothetical protein
MKFWQRIILIVGISATVLFILNIFYQKGHRRYYRHETARMNVLLDKNFYADILFIGSSRTHVHNNPRIIDSITHLTSYNFGVEGANLLEMNLWLQVYLQKHTRPKMVILDLPAFSFDTDRRKFFNLTIYLPWLNNDIIYSTLSKYKKVHVYKSLPFLEFMEIDDYNKFNAVKGLLGHQEESSAGYTFQGYTANGDNQINTGTRILYDTAHYKITSEGKQLLNAIIDSCKSKNIQFVITYSPEYYNTDYTYRTDFFNYINETAYKNTILFWDYRSSPICRDNKLFANPGHLNRTGADRFSEELAKDILKVIGK